MPQVFQVLKCYKCFVFQIHQTKKSNKFECKMCGEKQSIKRHYGVGTGKDCRIHVQKLNALRGNTEIKPTNDSNSDDEYEYKIDEEISENIKDPVAIPLKRSKWSAFMYKKKDIDAIEEPMFLGDREVVLEVPKKTKTRNFKVKAKSSCSKDDLYSINDSKDEFKFNTRFNNKDEIYSSNSNETILVVDNVVNSSRISIKCKEKVTCDNLVMEKGAEKDVKQTISLNSRWAQYVDREDDNNLQSNVLSKNGPKECVMKSDNLFSLCDDSDLDKVLDISF